MDMPQRASRRAHFSAAERWALLAEFDKCLDKGTKKAFYRQVPVAETTVKGWIAARAEGRLKAPEEVQPPRIVHSKMSAMERREFVRLERENKAMKLKLEQSEATVDILKKASALLESLAKSATIPPVEDVPVKIEGRPVWLKVNNDESS